HVIHDNLAPRLTGKLGKTLLGLDYTGDHIVVAYLTPTLESPPQPIESDYLTLGVLILPPSMDDISWHCGSFDRPDHPHDRYFCLVNRITTSTKSTHVKVTPPVQGYVNYRFRDIEGTFDDTFTTQIIKQLTLEAGDGKLYEVAPVVEYGGNLVYDETAGE